LIDTGSAVAKHLQKRLAMLDLLTQQHQAGTVRFWTNSQATDAKQVIEALWGKSAEVAFF